MVVGVFVLIGPFIGGVFFGVLILAESSEAVGWRELVSLPLTGLMGYVMGFWPALLTGAACGVISSRISSKILWVVLATVAGAAFSSLTAGDQTDAWRFFAPIGAVAALSSSLVALQVRPRWRN